MSFRNRAAQLVRWDPGRVLFVAEAPPSGDWRGIDEHLVHHLDLADVSQSLTEKREPERALAERLLGQRLRYLIVERTCSGDASERQNRMLDRLQHARSLRYFHPLLIGERYVLYSVAPPFRVTSAQAATMVAYLRSALRTGQPTVTLGFALSPVPGGLEPFEVGVTLRRRSDEALGGRAILRRTGRGPTLEAALQDAAVELREDWAARRVELADKFKVSLPGTLAAALDTMEIELDLAFDRAEVLDRDPARLDELFELGWHGAFLRQRSQGRWMQHSRYPAYATQRQVQTVRRLIDSLCVDVAGLHREAWRDPALVFGRLRSHSFLEVTPQGEVTALVRGMPPVSIGDVTRESLREALDAAGEHLDGLAMQDRQLLRRYELLDDRWFEGNTAEAHALATYALLTAGAIDANAQRIHSGREALHCLLANLRCETPGADGTCFLWQCDPPDRYPKSSAAAAALTALALIELSEVIPAAPQTTAILDGLGRHLLQMQDPNGHLRQYHVAPGHPYYGAEKPSAPGLILLALTRLHRKTGDKRYAEAFERGLSFYTEYWRSSRARAAGKGLDAASTRQDLAGFAPAMVLAIAERHRSNPRAALVDLALEVQAWIDETLTVTYEWADLADRVGGSRSEASEPPSIDPVQVSARAAALALTRRAGRDTDRLERDLMASLRFLLQLQYRGPASTYHVRRPWVALGGFRESLVGSNIETAYTAAAMLAIAEGLRTIDSGAQKD